LIVAKVDINPTSAGVERILEKLEDGDFIIGDEFFAKYAF